MKHIKTIPTNNLRGFDKKKSEYTSYIDVSDKTITFNNHKAFLWFKKKYDYPYLKAQKRVVTCDERHIFKANPTNIKIYELL